METYFDAVLDDRMHPVFNGTPDETREWLVANQWAHKYDVCIGKTMEIVPAAKYLERSSHS